MCVSPSTGTVYLASGQYNPFDPNASLIRAFSTDELKWKRSIEVKGMQHVTGITEDLLTGCLWVVGFRMDEIPVYPDPHQAFYRPYIANVPLGRTKVEAVCISDMTYSNLALPMSVTWTGELNTERVDIDGDNRVDFNDFAILTSLWGLCETDPDWNESADLSSAIDEEPVIDIFDLMVLAHNWLHGGSP
jgi:hypothetical protein